MQSKDNRELLKAFQEVTKREIADKILDDDLYYHVNTRWLNTFKKLSKSSQEKVVETIINLQNDWIVNSINKKITPINLEGFGKFIIRPGKRDFMELVSDPMFDGDYATVHAEVRKRIDTRVKKKKELRNLNLKLKSNG